MANPQGKSKPIFKPNEIIVQVSVEIRPGDFANQAMRCPGAASLNSQANITHAYVTEDYIWFSVIDRDVRCQVKTPKNMKKFVRQISNGITPNPVMLTIRGKDLVAPPEPRQHKSQMAAMRNVSKIVTRGGGTGKTAVQIAAAQRRAKRQSRMPVRPLVGPGSHDWRPPVPLPQQSSKAA